MKQILFLFFILLLDQLYVCKENLKLEELLSSQLESNLESETFDPDEMILKMKTFFDSYADKIKNSIKSVDKIQVNNEEQIYLNNFNLDDMKRESNLFLDENNSIREKDLKNSQEMKQDAEEKYIDHITKSKILNSRMNIGNSEQNKIMNDYNEKNNLKMNTEMEIKDNREKVDSYVIDNFNKLKILKENLKTYDEKILNLKLNEKVFEDEIKIQNNLDKLKNENFKADFDKEFFKKNNVTLFEYVNKNKNLDEIFTIGIKKMRNRIINSEDSIKNKTEIIKNIKKEIENKFSAYENLNNTISKLKIMQGDYKNALRNLDEELNLLKSKKKIIEENITDRKKTKNIRKRTIESVLTKSEKELDKFNVDKINVNKYRKDINSLNNRIRNLLVKENMIFNKNKIKI